jgi:hypothetical protein
MKTTLMGLGAAVLGFTIATLALRAAHVAEFNTGGWCPSSWPPTTSRPETS